MKNSLFLIELSRLWQQPKIIIT